MGVYTRVSINRIQVLFTMKVYQVVAILLLSLVCQRTTSQRSIRIVWDRHWLDGNLTDLTIDVNLGDRFLFFCQVNSNTENPEDVFENLVRLQVDRCNATGEMVTFIDECTDDGFDITIPVTSTPVLVNRPSFELGQVYYFTSFSDGTRQSAESRTQEGGGCSLQPPLRLTVSVVPKSSSVMISSTASSNFVTSTTVTSSSMVVATPTPTTTSGTTTAPTSTATPDQGSIGGAAGHLIPLNYFIILLIAIVSLILFN